MLRGVIYRLLQAIPVILIFAVLVVLSNHAQLVNGARPVRHPLALPMPIAVTVMMAWLYNSTGGSTYQEIWATMQNDVVLHDL